MIFSKQTALLAYLTANRSDADRRARCGREYLLEFEPLAKNYSLVTRDQLVKWSPRQWWPFYVTSGSEKRRMDRITLNKESPIWLGAFVLQLPLMVKAQKILLSTQTIATTSAGLLAPIYAIYVEKVGGGILETSASYALFAVVYGLLMLVMGKLTDKVKYQELFIAAGFFISAIGYVGYLFVSSVFHLFILQAILGIAQAVMTPAHDGLYTKHLDDTKSASEWATWEAVYAISTGVSAFVGGIIVYYISFEALFITMFLMSSVTGLYILLLPRGTI